MIGRDEPSVVDLPNTALKGLKGRVSDPEVDITLDKAHQDVSFNGGSAFGGAPSETPILEQLRTGLNINLRESRHLVLFYSAGRRVDESVSIPSRRCLGVDSCRRLVLYGREDVNIPHSGCWINWACHSLLIFPRSTSVGGRTQMTEKRTTDEPRQHTSG